MILERNTTRITDIWDSMRFFQYKGKGGEAGEKIPDAEGKVHNIRGNLYL